MAIVNGGYAKITKRVYEIEFRNPATGGSWGDYAYASNRSEACRIAGWDSRNQDGKIVNVVSEDDMSPNQHYQAMDWLNQRGGYEPKPGNYGNLYEQQAGA